MADSWMMAPARKQPSKLAPAPVRVPAPTPTGSPAGEEPPVLLALADLVGDERGEVVLFNDSGLRALTLATRSRAVEHGETGRHVTAAGEDVSGFRFVRFEDGLKLYYPPGIELVLVSDALDA